MARGTVHMYIIMLIYLVKQQVKMVHQFLPLVHLGIMILPKNFKQFNCGHVGHSWSNLVQMSNTYNIKLMIDCMYVIQIACMITVVLDSVIGERCSGGSAELQKQEAIAI